MQLTPAWFEDTTNSLVIQWHVDTLKAPCNQAFQAGYIISLDPVIVGDSGQVVCMWNDVTQKQNITKIPIYPEIVFDTAYAVGLWLRSYSDLLGPGMKSKPTDSSTCQIKTPPFTWEEIVLFPDTMDQVFAANEN